LPPRPVISNTSPLINLAGVGQLELLRQLYTEVWIPALVLAEYQAKRGADEPDLRGVPWIAVRPMEPASSLQALGTLGAGEAAAITLAQASAAQLVILDDKRARRTARQLRLPVVGTLGVLLAAKQLDLLPAIRPVLDALIAQGRRISPALYDEALRAAGEDAPEAA